MSYDAFLARKLVRAAPTGIADPGEINSALFPFQRDIVRWALRRGRAAIFANCGLGKTVQFLEWARHVVEHTGLPVLVLAPLAVSPQTVTEGEKFGIPVTRVSTQADVTGPGIWVTNYEKLHHFDPAVYGGVVLDESSVLKAFTGKFRNLIIESFAQTPFKLACTATPAPNDFMELGNHAEFLGAMSRTEMLSMFFVHDGGETQKWRLKGHAEADFWTWVCTWAVMLNHPRDLGYADMGFDLPPLEIVEHLTGDPAAPLAATLTERRRARKDSIEERCLLAADLIAAEPDESWLVWTGLNAEADLMEQIVPDMVQVAGADKPEWKIDAALWFAGAYEDVCTCQTTTSGSITRSIKLDTKSKTKRDEQTEPQKSVLKNSNTTAPITRETKISGGTEKLKNALSTTPTDERNMPLIQTCSASTENMRLSGNESTQKSIKPKDSRNTSLLQSSIENYSQLKAADAPYVDEQSLLTQIIAANGIEDSMSTTTTQPVGSGGSSALPVTLELVNSVMIQNDLSEQLCTCGKPRRPTPKALVSKCKIFGWGLNFQVCARMIFVGISDSYEQMFQAVRRCWRFGQERPVRVHIVTSHAEGAVVENVKRKEADAQRMAGEMVRHMADINSADIRGTAKRQVSYERESAGGDRWQLELGDCVDVVKELPDDSVDYSVFSPPFASLYTYSASDRDLGNVSSHDEFYEHFAYLIPELLRATKPGRLLSMHCMLLPTSKTRDGVIGLTDFRGELIRRFREGGWIFHSEVVIWKNPVTAMQRTKALGLLHKQIKKDSCMSRQGIPDYLVTMRKPGENQERVTHTNESFPVSVWQRYASPVWFDVNPSDTLQFRSAREEADERHICPLQLSVIERGIEMWSNPGDLVLDPFAGIGSTGHVALKRGRSFFGVELKRSYFETSARNLAIAADLPPDPRDVGEVHPDLVQKEGKMSPEEMSYLEMPIEVSADAVIQAFERGSPMSIDPESNKAMQGMYGLNRDFSGEPQ